VILETSPGDENIEYQKDWGVGVGKDKGKAKKKKKKKKKNTKTKNFHSGHAMTVYRSLLQREKDTTQGHKESLVRLMSDMPKLGVI
jgi:hypothetical protein